jgi:transcriptional regulator with XRE-family HTH domain
MTTALAAAPLLMSGSELRRLRRIRGLSQADLARASGVHHSEISLLEHDKRRGKASTWREILLTLGFDHIIRGVEDARS